MSEFRDEAAPRIQRSDPYLPLARKALEDLFDARPNDVFFSRQLEVRFEGRFYHWITNRALRDLARSGFLKVERRELASQGIIHVYWHHRARYVSRAVARLVKLVSEYASYATAEGLGRQGEWMVMEAFARHQFVQRGRETNQYAGRRWTDSDHDLDFIYERDGVAYGVEVKNTLGYTERKELQIKVGICQRLGVRPLMVCRMLPWDWVHKDITSAGGFALLLKWQLYDWARADLARRVREELGLPVDTPGRLHDGTMQRFVDWHEHQRV